MQGVTPMLTVFYAWCDILLIQGHMHTVMALVIHI